ncbi:MAG TPA: flavin reductase family protein [Anaerolineae bacterium]|nr:flavin reductase family protein [Anaerolineae bacterium]HNU03354.1 flavin reductase family protein [Anaerolineae bacterium]
MNHRQQVAGMRAALHSLTCGLYVLTSGQGTAAHAATITLVIQASQRPRRVAVGVRKDSHIYPVLHAQGTFALNVIGEEQKALAASFFKYTPAVDQQFANHPFEDGPATGSPLLQEAVAWLECRTVEEANTGGDHGLFIADVLAGAVRRTPVRALSLAATGWSYGG